MSFRPVLFCLLTLILFSCGGSSSGGEQPSDDIQYRLTNVGRSPLALTKSDFECDDFIESLQSLPEWNIAFLYHTFGNDFTCLNRLQSDPRLAMLVMHLINEPGHRNQRLGNYEFLANISTPAEYDRLLRNEDQNLKNRFIDYIQTAIAVANNIPAHTQCVVSPGLESNLSDAASRVLIRWTRELFPSHCRILWNPLRNETINVAQVGADLVEAHGRNPRVEAPCTINTDGTDISLPGRPSNNSPDWMIEHGDDLENYVLRYSAQCEIVFLWVVEDNCLRPGSFIDPRARRCSVAKETNVNHLLVKELLRIMRL